MPLASPPLADSSAGRGRRLFWPAVAAVALTGAVLVVHIINPYEPGNYPTCPWLAVTGTYCPGCGALRATHSLTHGDLGAALQRNPLVVVLAVAVVVGLAVWARRQWRGEPARRTPPVALLWVGLAAIVVFWIARNIPGWTWLSPV